MRKHEVTPEIRVCSMHVRWDSGIHGTGPSLYSAEMKFNSVEFNVNNSPQIKSILVPVHCPAFFVLDLLRLVLDLDLALVSLGGSATSTACSPLEA